MAMNNSKFDKYLLRSFLKNTGLAIISISAIALVIFACYVVYIGIGKASDLYPSGFAKINEITHGIKYLKSFSKRSETPAITVKATKEE